MMSLTLMVRGFKMPSLSLPTCILRWILPLSVSPSASLMGKSYHENDSFITLCFLKNNLPLYIYFISIYLLFNCLFCSL